MRRIIRSKSDGAFVMMISWLTRRSQVLYVSYCYEFTDTAWGITLAGDDGDRVKIRRCICDDDVVVNEAFSGSGLYYAIVLIMTLLLSVLSSNIITTTVQR